MFMNSLFGIILFILAVWAIASIINSSVEPLHKALWIALVLVLPVIGFIIWYFAGPKSAR